MSTQKEALEAQIRELEEALRGHKAQAAEVEVKIGQRLAEGAPDKEIDSLEKQEAAEKRMVRRGSLQIETLRGQLADAERADAESRVSDLSSKYSEALRIRAGLIEQYNAHVAALEGIIQQAGAAMIDLVNSRGEAELLAVTHGLKTPAFAEIVRLPNKLKELAHREANGETYGLSYNPWTAKIVQAEVERKKAKRLAAKASQTNGFQEGSC